MARQREAHILREALEDLEPVDENPKRDLSNATPLQVLEDLAVNGKSETARVQALKVLLDRQQQLEREKAERGQREPPECPRCAERDKPTPYDDPDDAKAIIVELAELGPNAVRAALELPSRRSDAVSGGVYPAEPGD